MNAAQGTYPLTYDVDRQMTERNRVTCGFRIILAIPHLLLVGGPGGFSGGAPLGLITGNRFTGFAANGVLGAVAGVMAIISWFAIVFTGAQPKGLYDFTVFYMRWRARAIAYTALLRDEYPPFGEGEYPIHIDFGEFPVERNRVTVGFRIFLIIPQAIVLFFVGIAWVVTAVIGWFAILFTGA
ncbi:MAG TPA: DUF4389 domain-containing protein, partial [Dehalococcoidia bacterium]|nr:DUF4389 domain-containing protein [Dehalococcoidia bacterium]